MTLIETVFSGEGEETEEWGRGGGGAFAQKRLEYMNARYPTQKGNDLLLAMVASIPGQHKDHTQK